jgi:hypothetical protein
MLPLTTAVDSSLTMTEQIVLATWAVKTAMVLEHCFDRESNFNQADRTYLMEQLAPPPSPGAPAETCHRWDSAGNG